MTIHVDEQALERRVKEVYRHVAQRPQDTYHFEMGRALAERLGYPPALLDQVPAAALESFGGGGYYHDHAAAVPGAALESFAGVGY
jgi:arsenite methyltransferase